MFPPPPHAAGGRKRFPPPTPSLRLAWDRVLVTRAWLPRADLCPSAGPREAQASLGAAPGSAPGGGRGEPETPGSRARGTETRAGVGGGARGRAGGGGAEGAAGAAGRARAPVAAVAAGGRSAVSAAALGRGGVEGAAPTPRPPSQSPRGARTLARVAAPPPALGPRP